MSAPKLAIVADDLTGAADSAARCVQAGLSAEIWIEIRDTTTTVDVVALSTDSRFLPADEAAQRVADTLASLSSWSGVTWYKKIDSTLRGNLGAELEGMLDALPDMAAVICPAFPAQQRGLADGRLVYTGAPPRHLPTLLAEQSALPVASVVLATVRAGAGELQRVLALLREQGMKLLVVDALTDADLDTIVAATQAGGYLLCGSAGLVAPWSAQWVPSTHSRRKEAARVQPGPLLALVGSGSGVAQAQVEQVVAAAAMRVRAIDKDWYQADLVGAESHPVGDWLLYLTPPDSPIALEGPTARAQAARLADLAFAAVDKLQPSALIVVGGDTAHYVLRRLGMNCLQVVEELLPGVPLTLGTDTSGQTRAVVLKPGNFGDAQTLLALQTCLHVRQGDRSGVFR